jgi:hypothetical protein
LKTPAEVKEGGDVPPSSFFLGSASDQEPEPRHLLVFTL